MITTLQPVDMAREPFLSGRFAPIHDEIDVAHLVVDGAIPTDLAGAYMRNGPNPKFTPLGSYTFPLEGDGMVHGVWIEGGTARYANRWVETNGLRAEERAGHALFGGVLTPAMVDPSLLGPDPDPGWPRKLDAFFNVVRHGGRLLALAESLPPYELAADLGTVGRCDFAGGLPAGICAHPKVDPVTGEMFVFRYDIEPPFLACATIGPDGTVTQPPLAVHGVDKPCMVHDFAITEHHVVLVVGPLTIDMDAMASGGDVLRWEPELGTRVAIIPRDRSGPTRWAHTDAFWAWHYANAYEADRCIYLDFPGYGAPSIVLPPDQQTPDGVGFHRACIDPDRGTVELHLLDGAPTEYPRVDDRLLGRAHRYVTVGGRRDGSPLDVGEHDQLVRFDMASGTRRHVDLDESIGEVCFAPRAGATDELDGYYLAFGTDVGSDRSSLIIWDAAAFPAPPVARIRIPQRVPNGLHGNWLPA
jgi:carotenoid cleavage dioxygenase